MENIKIQKFTFKQDSLKTCLKSDSMIDWPVVYILNGSSFAYIGQTSNFIKRMNDHVVKNGDWKALDTAHMIEHLKFNSSASLDLESFLIEYFSGDGKYKLLNGNGGLRNHNYFDRDNYRSDFESIWNMLREENLVDNDLDYIKNSDLFKMSPFKRLSPDQAQVANSIVSILLNSTTSRNVIQGGPGTGKTILAIYLMKYLADADFFKGKKMALVIPMSPLRKTIKKVFKNIKGLKANMVIGPTDISKYDGVFDILIVDEAHRLTRRKNLSNYAVFDENNRKMQLPEGATQLDWVKFKSKHQILFYDSRQTIRPSDIKNAQMKEYLDSSNQFRLKTQFRVKSDFDYLKFIDDLLNQNTNEIPYLYNENIGSYDLQLFNNLDDMIKKIKMRDKEVGLSRLVAGYSWKWNTKNRQYDEYGNKIYDIEIGDNKLIWNSTSEDWINSKNAINEVGCIHTTQGYDLNYCAVIIGKELVFRDGKIRYIPGEFKDTISKDNSLSNEEMLAYIRNIYKVLLTRGIYGTYVYACDDELRKYLAAYLPVYSQNEDKYMNTKVAEIGEPYKTRVK